MCECTTFACIIKHRIKFIYKYCYFSILILPSVYRALARALPSHTCTQELTSVLRLNCVGITRTTNASFVFRVALNMLFMECIYPHSMQTHQLNCSTLGPSFHRSIEQVCGWFHRSFSAAADWKSSTGSVGNRFVSIFISNFIFMSTACNGYWYWYVYVVTNRLYCTVPIGHCVFALRKWNKRQYYVYQEN